MRKQIKYIVVLSAGIFLAMGITVFAAQQVTVPASTGLGVIPTGLTNGNYTPQATSSIRFFTITTTGSSGAATYSNGILNVPQYSGGTGGTGTVSTSTVPTVGQLSYWTSNGFPSLLGSVATGTQTISAPLTGGPFTIIGSGGSIGCQAASGSQAGCLSSTDWSTFNGKQSTLTVTWPQILTGSTLSFGGLSTTTGLTTNSFPIVTGVNTFGNSNLTQVAGTTFLNGIPVIDGGGDWLGNLIESGTVGVITQPTATSTAILGNIVQAGGVTLISSNTTITPATFCGTGEIVIASTTAANITITLPSRSWLQAFSNANPTVCSPTAWPSSFSQQVLFNNSAFTVTETATDTAGYVFSYGPGTATALPAGMSESIIGQLSNEYNYPQGFGGSNSTIRVYAEAFSSTTPAGGNLEQNPSGQYYTQPTTTVSCSGTASCSPFTVLGSSPFTIIGSATGGGYPFTPSTDGGINTSATTTALEGAAPGLGLDLSQYSWLGQGGVLLGYASSTNLDTIFGLAAGGQNATTSATQKETTAFGYFALNSLTTGTRNLAIGANALLNDKTGSFNTAIGYQAGNAITGSNNITIGDSAYSGGTGAQNLIIGTNSSTNLTTGNGNIFLGNSLVGTTAGEANGLDIGNVLYGTNMYGLSAQSGTPTTNGSIGIASSSPYAKLSIHLNSLDTNTNAFAIGSSTASATTTLFSIDNGGNVTHIGSLTITGTATSTLAGGLNVTGNGVGCLAVNGTCITSTIANVSAYKDSSDYATVIALPANTYATGVLTEVGTGALSVDGASPSVGQSVLVKNEAAGSNNGIYTVTATGSGIAAYVLTRRSDFSTSADVFPGVATYVRLGALEGGDTFVVSNPPVIVLDTTALTFATSSNVGNLTLPITLPNGGTGLTSISGNQTIYTNSAGSAFVTTATSTLFGNGIGGQVVGWSNVTGGLTLMATSSSGGGGGTPSGASSTIQYNKNGAFGGLSTVNTDGTNLGIGTTTPVLGLSIASTTAIVADELVDATSSTMSLGMASSTNQTFRFLASAMTINMSAYQLFPGQKMTLTTCEGATGGGALTFNNVHFSGGVQPGNTTTANQCDMWFFQTIRGTSTPEVALTGMVSGIQ